MQHKKDDKIVLVSYVLFDLIPLWTVLTDYSETIYRILGIPVWKIRELECEKGCDYKRQYFLFGLPIAESYYENNDVDDEEYNDDYEFSEMYNDDEYLR